MNGIVKQVYIALPKSIPGWMLTAYVGAYSVCMCVCLRVCLSFHTNLVHGGSLWVPLLRSIPSMECPQQAETDLAIAVEVGVEPEACKEAISHWHR